MKQSILEREYAFSESKFVEDCNRQVDQASYRPTSLLIMNRVLDVMDELTGGRAGLIQQFFSFALIGGFGACVNLAVFYTVDHFMLLHINNIMHNAIAFIAASEISLFANFIPNDYFTFRHLAGNRMWSARCVRFHITAFSGIALTYLIQFSLNFFLHVPAFFAQATAILLVLFYNFAFHHLFTYRPYCANGIKSPSEQIMSQDYRSEHKLVVLQPCEQSSNRHFWTSSPKDQSHLIYLWHVVTIAVLLDHTPHAELWSTSTNGLFHRLRPVAGRSISFTIEIGWNNFLF